MSWFVGISVHALRRFKKYFFIWSQLKVICDCFSFALLGFLICSENSCHFLKSIRFKSKTSHVFRSLAFSCALLCDRFYFDFWLISHFRYIKIQTWLLGRITQRKAHWGWGISYSFLFVIIHSLRAMFVGLYFIWPGQCLFDFNITQQ